MIHCDESETTWPGIAALLCEAGFAAAGHSASVRVVRQNLLSRTRVLQVEVIPDTIAPAIPQRLLLQIGNGRGPRFTWRDYYVYRDIAPCSNTESFLPCYYTSSLDVESVPFIVLPDVSATHKCVPDGLPPQRSDAESMVDALASVHASWWDHPELGTRGGKRLSEFDIRRLYGFSSSHWSTVVDFLGDRLSEEVRRRCDDVLKSTIPRLTDRLIKRGGVTLLHGAPHPSTFLLPHEATSTTYLVNWDTPTWLGHVGCGAFDLAQLLIPFWSAERRILLQSPLLSRYYAQLRERGVTNYRSQDLEDDFRLGSQLLLHVAIDSFGRESLSTWYPKWERIVQALPPAEQ